MPRIIEFTTTLGRRLAIDAEKVEGLSDEGDGCCDVVTASDVWHVRCGFDEAKERIWPEA